MSRLTDPDRLQKEIEAQKKRAEALALLNSTGAERHYKPGEVRKAREDKEGDNTLDVVTLRKAQETYKDRLLQHQNSLRDGLEQRKNQEQAPLKQGWREVKDPKTGETYYWNKSSNTTSWTRPIASSGDRSKERSSKGDASAESAGTGVGGGSNNAGGGGAGGRGSDDDASKTPPPLPAGWTEVKDPKTGGVYFWNQRKGQTTWVRPTEQTPSEDASSSAASSPSLPEGWKAVIHGATGQTHYVHEASGQRSHTLPGSDRQQVSGASQPDHSQATGGDGGRQGAGARGRSGQERGSYGRDSKRRRGGRDEIDPLDPLGQAGGKWSAGLVQVGERMADSTASGPLWQQRPYPAPGKILRSKAPSEAETAGPRQRG